MWLTGTIEFIKRKNVAVNVTPSHFSTYTANADFGLGQDLGNGNFVLAATTQSWVNIHALEPGTVYHFAIFEYNGFNQPLYLSPGATVSAATTGVLPVKISSWEAVPVGNKVKLNWTTASEIDASHFIVERSVDGSNFSAIAQVTAVGNSQTENHYSSQDNNPAAGKSFYRLKMVDIDASFEYSAVRVVLMSDKLMARIAGNPAKDRLQVIVSRVEHGKNVWQIINSSGQVVKSGRLQAVREEINIETIAAGQYWIRIGEEVLGFVKL